MFAIDPVQNIRKPTVFNIFRGIKENIGKVQIKVTLRKKCPYSELFWSVFSRIRTEYGEI